MARCAIGCAVFSVVLTFAGGGCDNASERAPNDAAGLGADAAPPDGGDGGGITMTFDRTGCRARPLGGCDTLRTSYGSNDSEALSQNPDLAACAADISFDGCEQLVFAFDEDGCLATVLTRSEGSDHLQNLRACFASGLGDSRWPCVANGTVTFDESCFVR